MRIIQRRFPQQFQEFLTPCYVTDTQITHANFQMLDAHLQTIISQNDITSKSSKIKTPRWSFHSPVNPGICEGWMYRRCEDHLYLFPLLSTQHISQVLQNYVALKQDAKNETEESRQLLCLPCDHFVQAADYNMLAQSINQKIATTILLNPGMESWGVRPGRDAADLAFGITQLKSLRWEGFQLDLFHACDFALDQILSITEYSFKCLNKWKLTGNLHVWLSFENLLNLLKHNRFVKLMHHEQIYFHLPEPFLYHDREISSHGYDTDANAGHQHNYKADTILLSRIISRKEVEVIVLDAGTRNSGLDISLASEASFWGRNDITLRQLAQYHSVWGLGHDSLDLMLGDIVGLSPYHPFPGYYRPADVGTSEIINQHEIKEKRTQYPAFASFSDCPNPSEIDGSLLKPSMYQATWRT